MKSSIINKSWPFIWQWSWFFIQWRCAYAFPKNCASTIKRKHKCDWITGFKNFLITECHISQGKCGKLIVLKRNQKLILVDGNMWFENMILSKFLFLKKKIKLHHHSSVKKLINQIKTFPSEWYLKLFCSLWIIWIFVWMYLLCLI